MTFSSPKSRKKNLGHFSLNIFFKKTMNFTVYSKNGCPYCDQVKQVLDLCNFSYREYKLDEHFDRFAFTEEFGGDATFPQILLNNKKLGGCTNTVKYLKEHNLLNGSRRHAS